MALVPSTLAVLVVILRELLHVVGCLWLADHGVGGGSPGVVTGHRLLESDGLLGLHYGLRLLRSFLLLFDYFIDVGPTLLGLA